MEQPTDVEQAQRTITLVLWLSGGPRFARGSFKKMGVAADVEQVFDVAQPKNVEQAQNNIVASRY